MDSGTAQTSSRRSIPDSELRPRQTVGGDCHIAHRQMKGKGFGLIPHDSARAPLGQKFVAFLSQRPPIGPVLPTWPVRKSFAVYYLRLESLHGMEEILDTRLE